MRPIKLLMTGFESYKDETTIAFEEIGTKGLYLITGDTGAGKTTIFDAITYALYGEPSGADRDVTMLRSHFADENTPTKVELEFEANGKKYHIVRNPDYERKAHRGDGTTKESANAVLKFLTENREPVSGIQKVKTEVENILNLKKEQFCRIAMIAQGSFQKLLLSKKEEKQTLFRELFHTEKYQKLQESIKSDKIQAEDNLKNLNRQLRDALKLIKVNEHDEKAEEINHIKNMLALTEEDVQILKEFASQDEELLNQIKNQISEVEKKIESINSELRDGYRCLDLQKKLKTAEDLIASKKLELEKIRKTLSEAEEEATKSPELERQKTLLKESLNEYEEISTEEKKLANFNLKITEAKKNLNHIAEENKELSETLQNLKKELEPLRGAGEQIVTLEAELEKKSKMFDELDEIGTQLKSLSIDKKSLELAQGKASKANLDYLEANKTYSEKLRLFNLEQAGILAEGLKEGDCCPVCGSTHHPHLAVKSDKAPSQTEIEESKISVEKLQQTASDLSVEAGRKKTAVELAEKNIDKELKKYFENLTVRDENLSSEIEERKSNLKDEAKEIKTKLEQERRANDRRDEIENQIPEIEKEIETKTAEINQLQNNITGDTATWQTNSKTLENRKSLLRYNTLDEAKQQLKQLSEQIETLKQNVDNAKKSFSDCQNEISRLSGEAQSNKEQLDELKPVDIANLQSEKSEYTDRKSELQDQTDSLNLRKGINLESINAIEKLIPEITKATEYHNMVSALHDVATGSGRGRTGKPSLEVYVQMHCLDQINRRANLRLKTMTDNKYELRRRIEEDGDELGLDLNVKDFYTGRERNVQSLSGGEQFQASLSLALGLADEIQESSGGIRLDTMFIDEGFGTLDPETLNKAIKALEDLSDGDKLVGIISHVEELESRIPRKILVKKDDAGISRISLIND